MNHTITTQNLCCVLDLLFACALIILYLYNENIQYSFYILLSF